MEKGKIIKIMRDFYYVESNNNIFECQARGKFWKNNITPLVGDIIEFNIIDNNKGYIMNILPRYNELIRPPISNVDQALIVISAKEPNFSTNLLDKLLVVIEFNHIKPIIYVSKMDLLNKKEKKDIINILKYYKKIGYSFFITSQKKRIKKIFKNKITVITGQSGVGKSTLLNLLNKKLQLETNPISLSLGRGKHTTRHVELLETNKGYVADTPGFSALDFKGMNKEDIRDNFIEFKNYHCKYKGCMHLKEKDCLIKQAVEKGIILKSRYDNYIKFINGM
ncbi:MAG: ribosome small subunit-dependent GTPase A [Bacilli bacterium]